MSESRRISSISLSAGCALVLVAVQFAVISLAPSGAWVRIALPVTIALAPLALWAHRRHLGTWVIAVGLAANLAAILANGGLMPVRSETVIAAVGAERAAAYTPGEWMPGSKDLLVAEGNGRLLALGDTIIVRAGGGGMAASAGDVVILAGVALLAGEAALRWAMRQRRRPPGLDEVAAGTRVAA